MKTPDARLARRTRPAPADRRCWKCGSLSRYRTETLRQLGWQPCKTQTVVEWCGHAQEYVPWPEANGYWRMVPVL